MKAPRLPDEAKRLEALRQYEVLDTAPEQAFEDFTVLAAQICQTPIALVSLVDENRQWFKSRLGLAAPETSLDTAFCAHTILHANQVLEVRDASADPRFADGPLVTGDAHIRFYTGAPLVTPGGYALGTLCVMDRVPRQLLPAQLEALRALSRQVMAQLELRRRTIQLTASEREAGRLLAAAEESRRTLLSLLEEQKAAQSSLALFRTLLDQSQECIEIVDPTTGRMLDVNDATCRQHGYTREEYLQLTVFDVHPSLTRAEFEKTIPLPGAASALIIEGTHRRKDGSDFPVELCINRVTLERDYVVAIARDITERRRAEHVLRESEERFRQLTDTIQEVFWITDVTKQAMLYISPGYEKIWGRTCESLYARPWSWAEAICEEDRDRVRHAATTKQAAGTYDETYRVVRPDGSLRWVRDRAFPIRDERGKTQRIVGVAEDITERKKLEEQFLRAQRLEAIGTLSGGIAHDLNNILAPMLMVASMLKPKLVDSRDLELLRLVEHGAHRGATIIRQLLTFSRGIEGERGIVQVRHLMREMVALMRETFPREITLAESCSSQLWPVLADATQLHQVLMNLCVNARDAMPAGGRLTLTAQNTRLDPAEPPRHALAKAGPYVLLTISDTGHGIPQEYLDRIFEPFFTTKEPGKGTGLGLSTVIGIVKSHGGFVTVYSEPARGSVFKIYLPAVVAGPETIKPAELEPSRGRNELVLVVDDEPAIRTTLARVLENHGYRVLVAADGRAAIELFLQHPEAVRLVITDVMMPVMNGVALIETLQGLAPDLKFIAASGLQDRDRGDKLATLGVTEILSKPCTSVEILEAVSRQLPRSVANEREP